MYIIHIPILLCLLPLLYGWQPIGPESHPYQKGSRHNKIGMWIMYIFYGIITVQIIHLLTVLPWIFPALMGTGLALAGYVVIRVNWE